MSHKEGLCDLRGLLWVVYNSSIGCRLSSCVLSLEGDFSAKRTVSRHLSMYSVSLHSACSSLLRSAEYC